MNSKRMRPFNGFIKTDKLYYSLVQSLGSSSILPSQVRFFQDFNELINTGNVYQRGLLIKLQYVLARTGGEFQNHAIDICKEIYCSSMQQDRSNIWNVFNYAALMETLGRNDEAIKALFEALDILGSSGSPNYSGVPCTFISEEWFQELNIYNYMDTKSCVASTTRLLGSLILTKLATIFASRNDNAEAVNLFRKAIEYYPQNSEANYWYGILTLPVNTQVAYRYLKSAYDLNSYNHRYWKPLLNTAQLLGRENECSGLRKEMERLKPLSESVYGQIENSTI
jgi:tetratricopeptide (TPR) repeat protein